MIRTHSDFVIEQQDRIAENQSRAVDQQLQALDRQSTAFDRQERSINSVSDKIEAQRNLRLGRQERRSGLLEEAITIAEQIHDGAENADMLRKQFRELTGRPFGDQSIDDSTD